MVMIACLPPFVADRCCTVGDEIYPHAFEDEDHGKERKTAGPHLSEI